MSKNSKTLKLGGVNFKKVNKSKLHYTNEDIQRVAEIHDDRITDDWLKRVGFINIKDNKLNRDIWRLKVPFYRYEIQFYKGNYPSTNPNCGCVSIYEPEQEVFTISNDGTKYVGLKHQQEISIAWYVSTKRRLTTIIQSLTQVNCC